MCASVASLARRPYTHTFTAHRCRWACAIATLDVLVDFSRHGDVAQPLNTMFGKDRGGLIGRRRVRQARLALFAFIQRVELGDGVRDALSQALLLAHGEGQRAHDQTALLPRMGLAGLIRRAEIDRGTTLAGPHRDEWRLRLGGLESRTHASQGEQRTLALALRLGGHQLCTDITGTAPVLLLDDVFSELDEGRSSALTAHLTAGQTLVTTAGRVPEGVHADRVFHVEAGRVAAAA